MNQHLGMNINTESLGVSRRILHDLLGNEKKKQKQSRAQDLYCFFLFIYETINAYLVSIYSTRT